MKLRGFFRYYGIVHRFNMQFFYIIFLPSLEYQMKRLCGRAIEFGAVQHFICAFLWLMRKLSIINITCMMFAGITKPWMVSMMMLMSWITGFKVQINVVVVCLESRETCSFLFFFPSGLSYVLKTWITQVYLYFHFISGCSSAVESITIFFFFWLTRYCDAWISYHA